MWHTLRLLSKTIQQRLILRKRPDQILAIQQVRLRSVVALAKAGSPFYAERLRDVNPARFELAELPTVTKSEMMENFDAGLLLCSHARLVSDRGVHACPILLEAPDARLGDSLYASLQPYPLRHHACLTCYQYGSICSNPTGGPRDA